MPSAVSLRRARTWLVPVLVVLVAVVLIVLSRQGDDTATPAATAARSAEPRTPDGAAGGSGDPAPEDPSAGADEAPPQGAGQDLPDMTRRDPGDPLAAGDVDAPVGVVVYSDYQCPFCAEWVAATQPTIMSDYVSEGQVRLEWRDVNVFGPESRTAARAAYAAGLQDRFWDYHDALYPDGEHRSPEELSTEALVDLAAELGLDADRFAADMESAEVAEAVQRNEDEGISLGAFSTPSFLIDGRPVVGAQPTEVFVEAIEAALDERG